MEQALLGCGAVPTGGSAAARVGSARIFGILTEQAVLQGELSKGKVQSPGKSAGYERF